MIKDIPDWTTAIEEARETTGDHENVPYTFNQAAEVIGKALELLLISKHQKYGTENILKAREFGLTPQQGAMLRENDKTERIKNGFKGVDLGKEGFIESYGDKIGYSAICILLEMGWYTLPLKEMKLDGQ